ncbi:AAA family ATPase [Streptomyces echinatus]|uniref:AAA family ATPase n=1 Tax=Streptomyces echinatus TaxID=67293 RepID=UPI00378C5C21
MGKMLGGQVTPVGLTPVTECPPFPQGGSDAIAGWLDRNPDARMVVIDVFAKMRGPAPQSVSAYDADHVAVGYAKRIVDHYGIAVVLVHHVRKAGSDDFLTECRAPAASPEPQRHRRSRRRHARAQAGARAGRRHLARHRTRRRRSRVRASVPSRLRRLADANWLRAGLPVAEVSRRAGNSPEVIHRRYAGVIDDSEEENNRKIEKTMGWESSSGT